MSRTKNDDAKGRQPLREKAILHFPDGDRFFAIGKGRLRGNARYQQKALRLEGMKTNFLGFFGVFWGWVWGGCVFLIMEGKGVET